MTGWLEFANYSISVSGYIISLVGLILSYVLRRIHRWNRYFFVCLFLILHIYAISNILFTLSTSKETGDYTTISKSALFISSVASSALMPMLTIMIHHISGFGKKQATPKTPPVAAMVFFIWIVYLILLCVAQVTEGIYYFSPDNVYHRGPYYFLLPIPAMLLMIVNILYFISMKGTVSKKMRLGIALYIGLPFIAMILQLIFSGLLFIVFSSSVASLVLFGFMISDYVSEYIRQNKEVADQKVNIMTLQMRPHFVCNTLLSIYYLCDDDPKKAQYVILNFTDYLRKNFTAMSKEDLVPFSEELEHAKAYLAVEQVRFEGKIDVEFDTPHTSFKIPPLTLQPLVENSVKHGVSSDNELIKITVRTSKTDGYSILVVEDTGVGPGNSINEGTHTAFENIKNRLELMCEGSVIIEPMDGGGTRVTVTVPDA